MKKYNIGSMSRWLQARISIGLISGLSVSIMALNVDGEPEARLVPPVRARSICVAWFSLGDVRNEVTLRTSIRGPGDADFVVAEFLGTDGAPLRLPAISEPGGPAKRQLTIPVVGSFAGKDSRFYFERAGTYTIRWEFYQKPDSEPISVIEQSLRVLPASDADDAFLKQISDLAFLRKIYEREPFEQLDQEFQAWACSPDGADFRALSVVAELLAATKAKEPGDIAGPHGRSVEDSLRWAQSMDSIASEYPQSSYSPYAKFFSACADLLGLAQQNKKRDGEVSSAHGMDSIFFAKAKGSLDAVAQRSDAFLKPRAHYMQAFLYGWTSQWDRAVNALDNSARASEGDDQLGAVIEKLRAEALKAADRSRKP